MVESSDPIIRETASPSKMGSKTITNDPVITVPAVSAMGRKRTAPQQQGWEDLTGPVIPVDYALMQARGQAEDDMDDPMSVTRGRIARPCERTRSVGKEPTSTRQRE